MRADETGNLPPKKRALKNAKLLRLEKMIVYLTPVTHSCNIPYVNAILNLAWAWNPVTTFSRIVASLCGRSEPVSAMGHLLTVCQSCAVFSYEVLP
jgi:hypothetical protein